MIILVGSTTLIPSCTTKKMIKKASKFEQSGMHSDAAEIYYQVLLRKKTNIDALTGLKRSGEFTLGAKLSQFNRAYNEQKNKEAVHYYLDAQAYHEKIKRVGVQLNFPSFYTEYYNEVKDIYLEDKYFEGMNYLNNEAFVQAERAFREIIKIQPTYKDTKEKLNIAVFEPIYRESLVLMENGKYREAYFKIDNIITNLGTYKDSHDLRRECLDKGSVSIAINPVKNSSNQRGIETQIENMIIVGIQNQNNPFIKLIDQTKSSRDITAKSTVLYAAPDATLFIEIVAFSYNAGKLGEETKTGYLKKRVKYKNPETERDEYRTEYDKVTYKEFQMSRSVELQISFRLINERRGEILRTGSRTLRAIDNIHFARYDGNKENLVPGYWKNRNTQSEEDIIRDNRNDVQNLQSLLNARNQIKDFNTLSSEVYNNSTAFVASEINKFVLEN